MSYFGDGNHLFFNDLGIFQNIHDSPTTDMSQPDDKLQQLEIGLIMFMGPMLLV